MTRPARKLILGATIGTGHFGEVWAGKDPIHGDVAVKILKRSVHETDAEWKARRTAIVTEGRRLSDATHEHVVRVFYVRSTRDGPRLVMERCLGGSLQALYKAGPMPLGRVRQVLTDVATGLAVLHGRGMLHRDIKPSNILIDADSGRAKLGDFGLVTDELVLGYASAAGYTDHLAYEVFHRQGTSARTDIWALGMTAYRLLHGKDWYESECASPRLEVAKGGFARRLPWLPHVPSEWRRFIRKTMNDDPSRRFQSATALLDGLAVLPVSPEWSCTVQPTTVTWERQTPERQYRVEWNRNIPTPSWRAQSINRVSGSKRTLRDSTDLKALESHLERE